MAPGFTPFDNPDQPATPGADSPERIQQQIKANAQGRRIVMVEVLSGGKEKTPNHVVMKAQPVDQVANRAGEVFIQSLYTAPVAGNALALYDMGADIDRLCADFRNGDKRLAGQSHWAILIIDTLGGMPGEAHSNAPERRALKEVVLEFAKSEGRNVAVNLLWNTVGGHAVKYLAELEQKLTGKLQPEIIRTLKTVAGHLRQCVQNPSTVAQQAARLTGKKGFMDWLPSAEHITLYGLDELLATPELRPAILEAVGAFGNMVEQRVRELTSMEDQPGALLQVIRQIAAEIAARDKRQGKRITDARTSKPFASAPSHDVSTGGAHSYDAQVSTGAPAQQHVKGNPHIQDTQKDANPDDTPAQGTCGGPKAGSDHSVDFATGDESLWQMDFKMPGVVPVVWRRLYRSSLAAYDGSVLGARWSSPYHLSLVEEVPGELVFHDEENRAVKLPPVRVGERIIHTREKLEIVRPDNMHVELHYLGGICERYEHHPRVHSTARHYRLVSRTGRDGLGHWLTYSEAGELTRIKDGHGLHVGLEYTGGHVTTIHRLDVSGTIQETLARYTYSAQGDLLTHTNAADHTRTYAYEQHLLVRYTDFSGFATHLHWDWPERAAGGHAPASARVIHEWRSAPGREEARYDESHFMYQRSRCYTKVTDTRGNETFYRYNLGNQIIAIEPAGGGSQYFLWDENANLVQTVDASGRSQYMEYDDAGRPISHTNAMGQTTRTEYDSQGLPVAQILPTGETVRTVFDSQGRPVFVTDVTGRITQYQWNAHSRLAALTDPKGGTRQYTWSALGLLESATDCSGQTTQYRYDPKGNLSQRIDALGQTTAYRHDVLGRPETITQADGSTHKFEHDTQGNLLAYTDAAGQTTRWRYNGQGLPVWREDAAGRTLRYQYDEHWQLTELHNENNQAMRFTYDPAGQLVEETGFDGKVSQFVYDAAGNQAESLTGGVHVQRQYDGLGRLRVRESRSGGTLLKDEYFYDSHGRLATARNNTSGKIHFHYDEVGNLLAEEQHVWVEGREYVSVIRHAYDALGNRVRTMLPNTRMVDWLRYGSGHVHGVMLDQQPLLDLERDALHRETSRQHARFTQQRTYDPLGRLTRLEARDTQNQRLASRQMKWNRAGHLEQIADAARGNTRYGYDPTGRILEAVTPDLKEIFAFDPAGNPVDPEKVKPYPTDVEDPKAREERRAREAAERAAWNAAHPEKERFSPLDVRALEDMQKISAWEESLPRCLTNMLEEYCRTRYEHDERGNLTSRTLWNGPQWRYEWDAANRLKAACRYDRRNPSDTSGDPDLAIRFLYDAFGRRTLKEARYPDGRIKRTVFTWDGSTLLLEEHFEQPVLPREERIALLMHEPRPLKVICEYPPDSDPLPVAQRLHQLDTKQWRGMSMYLYEPDSFVPLARLDETLEEPEHVTLGPDGEFIEHPAKSRHTTYFYQNDHLGTPQELVDEEGEIVWLGKYRAWGELRSAIQQNGQPAKVRNALRFQGQYCDDETGLHYNLHRYYDPQAGRFISKDPIGLNGGINMYMYGKNPVSWIDPLGLHRSVEPPNNGVSLNPPADSPWEENYNGLLNTPNAGQKAYCHKWTCETNDVCTKRYPYGRIDYTPDVFIPNNPPRVNALLWPQCQCTDASFIGASTTNFTDAYDAYYEIKDRNDKINEVEPAPLGARTAPPPPPEVEAAP